MTRPVETTARSRPRLLWLAPAIAALLAGCAHAPGMTLDATSESVNARVDLRPINLALVQRIEQERRARADAGPRLPPAFRTADAPWEYRVAPQDVLRVTVWNQPELTNPSGTTTELSGRVVNGDGTMFFPHIGNIRAAGRSVQEIRADIAGGLARVIRSPQVDVSVLQFRGQRIYVSGEIRSPGSVPVTDVPPDLTEVLARAGGPTAEADLASVTVTRGSQSIRIDLQALYYGGDLRGNVRLQHGDIVNVPERRAARVFVTGEVNRQAALPMPRGEMTLADALADAGGVNPLSASAGQIYVIRASESGGDRPLVYHLDAATPDALLLADQFTMRSRDVVYVDAAPVVRWNRMISNILPTATFLRDTFTKDRTTR